MKVEIKNLELWNITFDMSLPVFRSIKWVDLRKIGQAEPGTIILLPVTFQEVMLNKGARKGEENLQPKDYHDVIKNE